MNEFFNPKIHYLYGRLSKKFLGLDLTKVEKMIKKYIVAGIGVSVVTTRQ